MLFMHQSNPLAVALIVAALPSAALAATDMHVFDAPGLAGEDGPAVAYTSCDDPDGWHECIDMGFGCSPTAGWIAFYDGSELGRNLLQDNVPAMTFHTAGGNIQAPIWSVRSDVNEMDGGWVVTIIANSEDTLPVFKAIADTPSAAVSVSVAGQTFDLAPTPADQSAFGNMAAACVARFSAASEPLDTMSL